MAASTAQKAPLPIKVRQTLDSLAEALQQQVGEPLVAAVLYGPYAKGSQRQGRTSPIHLMLVLSDLSPPTLDRVRSVLQRKLERGTLGVMVLGEEDLRRSMDVFPVKFLDMRHNHVLLCGKDVLAELSVEPAHLRLRCEQMVRNIMIRLREVYVRQSRHPKLLQAQLWASLSSLLTALNGYLYLTEQKLRNSEAEIAAAAERHMDLDPPVLSEAVRLRDSGQSLGREQARELFIQLSAAVQRAAESIDRFPASEQEQGESR